LTANVQPPEATNAKVTWTSSNPAVATVSPSGIVTGVGPGSATISATTIDGGHAATIPVTVAAASQALHSISVRVSGLDGGKLVLRNNAAERLEVSADGNHLFPNKTANYSVTVERQPLGFQYCKVSDGAGVATGDVTVAVSCAKATPKVDIIAGTVGVAGKADGIGSAASFRFPTDLALDPEGNVYVTDAQNFKIRKITPAGVVTTFAGSGARGKQDGVGTAASFELPYSIAADAKGNLYVADAQRDGQAVRRITPTGGVLTVAKSDSGASSRRGAIGVDTDGQFYLGFNDVLLKGPRLTAKLMGPGFGPTGVAFASDGSHYTTDTGRWMIDLGGAPWSGNNWHYAGAGKDSGQKFSDGTGYAAAFNDPRGLAVDASGFVYVADYGNRKVRRITPPVKNGTNPVYGTVTTVADLPWAVDDVGVDKDGNIYVTSSSANVVAKITPAP
jgi:sugar lactone lactonase YvrE